MNSREIAERLTRTLPVAVRVCPLDRLFLPTYPAAFVVNFDTANLPGTHWGLICLHSDRSVTFFDPLCIEPVPEILLLWLSLHVPKPVAMNCQSVQHPLSTTCGAHVIFVAEKHFVHRLSIERILKHCYTNNLLENDAKVRSYCLQINNP